MRVALLSNNAQQQNAVGNLLAEKVRFFHERGAEVLVFVADATRLHSDLRAFTVEVSEVQTEGPTWNYLCQADLIVAVYSQYFDLLQYLPCLAGGPTRIVLAYLGITPPQLWPDQHREGLRTSLHNRAYAWCADHVLTISQFLGTELLEATSFPAPRVTQLPVPVDVERFRPGPRGKYLQQKLLIDGKILLYIGRLAGNKRVPVLIDALARLEDPAIHVVIVGDLTDVYAEEAGRCCAQAHKLRVLDRVHFLGQIDDADLPQVYRSADVLVMPSVHEGFGVPVVEAMACGIPVVACRGSALPETLGDAGLTFTPEDAEDLARQLRRVLKTEPPLSSGPIKRVAIVSFRFGSDIVGGAETSLRILARALQDAGHQVEIFTTCTKSESAWKNDWPAGSGTQDGLTVHHFAVDAHVPIGHGEVYRTLLEANGKVTPEWESAYLDSSVHSSPLIEALTSRANDFDAVVAGPYLFGLTADVAAALPEKTLVLPCFHDEALARLAVWPRLYGGVGGILYHSDEEQRLAQDRLGINHPNAWQVGIHLPPVDSSNRTKTSSSSGQSRTSGKPYVVYCGRYSAQKNVVLLLEWAQQYQRQCPGRFDFVFMGRGEVPLPAEPWLQDLGTVDETTKQSILAGAAALVQLSCHESLSIVALEAWREATPVIAHSNCSVLAGQIGRSQGGISVAEYDAFADALNDLWRQGDRWRQMGCHGQAYVAEHYTSSEAYVERLIGAVEQLSQPLRNQMHDRGLLRAQLFSRESWQHRFGACVERILTEPARSQRPDVRVEPVRTEFRATPGTRTLLIPVRVQNHGTHAAVPDGPARTVIAYQVHAKIGDETATAKQETSLPVILAPNQRHVAALPVSLPEHAGHYRLSLWTEAHKPGCTVSKSERCQISLTVELSAEADSAACGAAFLETVQKILPCAHEAKDLPASYVDVTEGWFAPVKRFVKQKLLNNFKRGYIDVLSRQQSEVNGQVVLMIQQLTECCAVLDHAVNGLHQRLDALEKKQRVAVPEYEVTVSAPETRSVR